MGLESPKRVSSSLPTRVLAGSLASISGIAAVTQTACGGAASPDECVAFLNESDRRGFPFDSDAVAYVPNGNQWTAAFDVPEDEAAESCQLPFRVQVRGDVYKINEGDTEPTLHVDVALGEPVTVSDVGAHVLTFDASGLEDIASLRLRVQLPDGTTKDTPEHLVNATNPLDDTEFPATGEPGDDRNTDAPDDLPDPFETAGSENPEEE